MKEKRISEKMKKVIVSLAQKQPAWKQIQPAHFGIIRPIFLNV